MTRPIFVLQAYMHLLMKHCVRVDNGNAVYLGLSSTNTSKLTGSAPSFKFVYCTQLKSQLKQRTKLHATSRPIVSETPPGTQTWHYTVLILGPRQEIDTVYTPRVCP